MTAIFNIYVVFKQTKRGYLHKHYFASKTKLVC